MKPDFFWGGKLLSMKPANPTQIFKSFREVAKQPQAKQHRPVTSTCFCQQNRNCARMGRRSDISDTEKMKICCWLEDNVKTGEISRRLGRHPGAIRKVVKRIRDENSSLTSGTPPLPPPSVPKIGIFK